MSTAPGPLAPAARTPSRRPRLPLVLLAVLADAACVLALATGGLAAHTPGEGVVRLLYVAWPFAAGAAAGWAVTRAWRRPWRVWPTGVVVWGCAWALGILLRVLTGQGVAPAFQLVSFGFLAATMLGWRGVVALVDVLSPAERRRRARDLGGR
ncbi:DUF3054 domain-containing protein [Cellulosimicrobium marinum]|uniref:DUF3054 domain-containing protein n=1 Tax=Cellulosimicrobium marinum TaxID=1638992 RepID=UPI001E5B2336|nr:DUF3054 domain-containing protein [Cellulosimicrobium marinum]MCB7136417.1 DUF3054 domain-containing protein [Cellulosimicrobium marinum]